MAFNGLVSNQIAVTHSAIGRTATEVTAKRQAEEAASKPGAGAAAAAETLVLHPMGERRRANYASFVRRSRSVDPHGAANLEATLATDPTAAMAPELARQDCASTT